LVKIVINKWIVDNELIVDNVVLNNKKSYRISLNSTPYHEEHPVKSVLKLKKGTHNK